MTFPALAPLVRGPMFASADGLLHLYRLVEFDQGFRAGNLYPRWAPDLLAGYGYPIFIFYAPLLYYLGEAFHLAGLGFVDALKAAVAAGIIGSAAGMYLLGRDVWGRWGGLVAAAAYVYAPYRLVNTYLDGELAQTLAWAWLPWLLWLCLRYVRRQRLGYGLLAASAYGGLIVTHSVTSWLASLFLTVTGLLLLATGRVRLPAGLKLGALLALGAAMAAPYWLPALREQAYVQLDRVRIATYDFHTNLLPLDRVLSTSWAHRYAEYVGVNGPAQLGLMQVTIALLGLGAGAACAWRRRSATGTIPLIAAPALLSVALMLRPAAAVWERIPFGHFLQFPDRLLLIAAVCLALLAGALPVPARRIAPAAEALTALLACCALIYGATSRLEVNYVALPTALGPSQVTDYEQVSGATGTTAKGEFTPRWMGAPPLSSPWVQAAVTGGQLDLSAGGTRLLVTAHRPEALYVEVGRSAAGTVELPLAYFPGWQATVNDNPRPVSPSPRGLTAVDVPAGESRVSLRFGATPDRRLAGGIGLTAALLLAGLAAGGLWQSARTRAAAPQEGEPAAANGSRHNGRVPAAANGWATYGSGAALLAGAGILAAGLALAPGKLNLAGWPAQRPELISYAGWLQLMGADVALTGDHLEVTPVFRTGNAANARPVAVTARLMTRETVWASGQAALPKEGWTTAVPRGLDIAVPLPPGTPAGVYLLELQVAFDDGVKGPDSTRLSYGSPRVGTVSLGAVRLSAAAAGRPAASPPREASFGPLTLAAWQPPVETQQGAFVPIDLWWQVDAPPNGDWGISVHIVDGQGQVWAGHDDRPRLGYNPTTLWRSGGLQRDVQMVLLPEGIPPGSYTALAGWYDAASGKPVGPQNVALGSLRVVPSDHPRLDLLNVPHTWDHTFGADLRLLGYDLSGREVMAGQGLPLRLFWQTTARPERDHRLTVWFRGQRVDVPLPATGGWRAGQLMETRLVVPVPQEWSGSGPLELSLDGARPEVRLPETVTVTQAAGLTELPPGLAHVEPDTLGGLVKLAGYRETRERGRLRLSLYWQALGPLPSNLHVFTHLLDGQNHVVSQHDGVPGDGRRPTGTWKPSQFVEDVHDMAVPSSTEPLQVEVGLYDAGTGQRLGDRLLLAPVQAG